MKIFWPLALLACLSTVSWAQLSKLSNPYSLEYLVDSSDLVVMGRVAEAQESSIQIDVTSVLKGESAQRITVEASPTEQESKDVEAAKKAKNEVLWFLTREGERYRLDNIDDRSYGLTFSQLGRRIFPAAGRGYTIGFEDRLLDRIEKEVARKPGRDDRSITVPAPWWMNMKTFTLPSDERTEKLAQAWVMPISGDADMRLLGVHVLRHYKTEGNATILKGLVHDPGSTRSTAGVSDFKAEAANVLKEWGIPVPTPPVKDDFNANQIAKAPIRIAVNGVEVKFKKGLSPPVLINGRAYARACSISDELGAKMMTYRLRESNGVQIDTPSQVINMPFDSRRIWVDKETQEISTPARLVNDEGFFPIRWFVEWTGGKVMWNPKLRRVEITTKQD